MRRQEPRCMPMPSPRRGEWPQAGQGLRAIPQPHPQPPLLAGEGNQSVSELPLPAGSTRSGRANGNPSATPLRNHPGNHPSAWGRCR